MYGFYYVKLNDDYSQTNDSSLHCYKFQLSNQIYILKKWSFCLSIKLKMFPFHLSMDKTADFFAIKFDKVYNTIQNIPHNNMHRV